MKRFLLQVTPSTDRTVEIIKAIGSSWPLILIIIATIVFFIYRKRIFNIKLNPTSVKTPIGDFQFETLEKIELKSINTSIQKDKKEETTSESNLL